MDKTPNYQLSQWERTDRVLMEDFNADNAKLDAALKAEADARAAADKTLTNALNRKGNCTIGISTYTGTGTNSKPTKITFAQMPTAFLVFGNGVLMGRGGISRATMIYNRLSTTILSQPDITWSGNSFSIFDNSGPECQMNVQNSVYTVVAFYSES